MLGQICHCDLQNTLSSFSFYDIIGTPEPFKYEIILVLH